MKDQDPPAPTHHVASGTIAFDIILPNADEDYIQKHLASNGAPYEPEMLADMRGRLAPGDLVVDVGANIGNHTLYLAACGAAVEAYEPNEALAKALRLSCERNGFTDRVTVHTAGVGRIAGSASFEAENPANLGAQRLDLGEGEIEVVCLDETQRGQPVRILKIDVEGMELDVLHGASKLIESDRPLIYVECPDTEAFNTVSAWLEARNYTAWDMFNATPTHLFIPLEEADADRRLARLQTRAIREDYGRIREVKRVRRFLEDARRSLATEQTKVVQLRAEKAALEERYAARVHDIAVLTREFSIRNAELEAALEAAQEAERAARAAQGTQGTFRSRTVLSIALPFLRPHLSASELELYRTDPSKLFLNAQHPVMVRVGRMAGFL